MKIYEKALPVLALFGSLSTLLCCALPALFVSLGAGAAVVSVVSTFPQLIWLSEHKAGLFAFAGGALLLSGASFYARRNDPCPVEPALAKTCRTLRRAQAWTLALSTLAYATGFVFAFVAPYFMQR